MARDAIKDKRRQQLIEANIAAIAKHGLLQTTIAHVSSMAEMSRGIVNFYFSTKDAMMRETLTALVDDRQVRLSQVLERAASLSPLQRLEKWVEAHFSAEICQLKRLSVWNAFLAEAGGNADFRRIIEAEQEKSTAQAARLCLDMMQAEGHHAGQDEAIFTGEVVHATIRGAWLMLCLKPSAAERSRLEAVVMRACHDMMMKTAPAQQPAPRRTKPMQAAEPLLFDL